MISEPATEGQIVNPGDVHMETRPFSDPDPSDTHLCSDWEIWTAAPSERVWITACIGGDGIVDISDARFTLNFLFGSGAAPNCLDAADADDGGEVDISDAIRTLNYLFLGAGPPARPFPTAGTDDTPDSLAPCSRGL